MHEQVDVIGLAVELAQFAAQTDADICHEVFAAGEHVAGEDGASVLGDKHQVRVQRVDRAAAALHVQFGSRRCHGGTNRCRARHWVIGMSSCRCPALRSPL